MVSYCEQGAVLIGIVMPAESALIRQLLRKSGLCLWAFRAILGSKQSFNTTYLILRCQMPKAGQSTWLRGVVGVSTAFPSFSKLR